MFVLIVKIFAYILAILLTFRVVVWAAAEVKKNDSPDGVNYWDLKHEIEQLERDHMEREKRR